MANESGFKLDKLSVDQQSKLDNCKTPEDVLALAAEEGYVLSDEELDQVAGGAWGADDTSGACPSCGSTRVSPQGMHSYECLDCHKHFKMNASHPIS